jgi:hypothetical protein
MPWVNEKDRLVPIITDETVNLFERGREIREAGADRTWEPEDRRREFFDVCVRLHALLGRKPWMVDVLEVDSETPPAWMTQEDQRADWCCTCSAAAPARRVGCARGQAMICYPASKSRHAAWFRTLQAGGLSG